MAEAVRFAGGWLCDMVMAGWDATVVTVDQPDSRPLQILGAHVVDLDSDLATSLRNPGPHAIAVDADLYDSDTRVHQVVLDALDRGVTDIRIWGDRWPADLDGQMGAAPHRLSVAARAFKAQALAAAAEEVDPTHVTEMFRSPNCSTALAPSGRAMTKGAAAR